MPCRSDYQEPNQIEIESKRVCNLLCYILPKVGRKAPEHVDLGSRGPYGSPRTIHEDTAILCEVCKNLTTEQADMYMYDGRNPEARQLATWWEEHQAADKAREEKEKRDKEENRQKTLSKMFGMIQQYPQEALDYLSGMDKNNPDTE